MNFCLENRPSFSLKLGREGVSNSKSYFHGTDNNDGGGKVVSFLDPAPCFSFATQVTRCRQQLY